MAYFSALEKRKCKSIRWSWFLYQGSVNMWWICSRFIELCIRVHSSAILGLQTITSRVLVSVQQEHFLPLLCSHTFWALVIQVFIPQVSFHLCCWRSFWICSSDMSSFVSSITWCTNQCSNSTILEIFTILFFSEWIWFFLIIFFWLIFELCYSFFYLCIQITIWV